MKQIAEHFVRGENAPILVSCGDAENDREMLALADIAVLFPQSDGKYLQFNHPVMHYASTCGHEHWLETMEQILGIGDITSGHSLRKTENQTLSDFFQNGIVTTLHNLKTRSLESLEQELHKFSEHSPMALILPCLYSELAQDALRNIIDTLNEATYLEHVVIGLDRATESEYRHALEYFSRLKITHTVLWNDGPRARELQDELKQHSVAPTDLGKGCNVWYCFGFIQSLPQIKVVALHDCDITTYDRALLARLLYPIANPQFNYQFCKGFYARVAEGKLNGRVSRLLVSPLLRSMKRVFPEQSFLEYLDSFRYPLAGEFAMRIDLW